MLRACELLLPTICMACLIFCCTACSPDIGQPLDLHQFSGVWFFAAGTPVNASLSRCGRFSVGQTSESTFTVKYTALSYKNNIPITFNIDGSVKRSGFIGSWQLEGSKKKLGPFQHTIVFANYNTVLGMVVCSESVAPHHRGYKFSMIWSRERRVLLPILEELKSKLGAYINQEEIRMVDHRNC